MRRDTRGHAGNAAQALLASLVPDALGLAHGLPLGGHPEIFSVHDAGFSRTTSLFLRAQRLGLGWIRAGQRLFPVCKLTSAALWRRTDATSTGSQLTWRCREESDRGRSRGNPALGSSQDILPTTTLFQFHHRQQAQLPALQRWT